jgi:hypothetical protein
MKEEVVLHSPCVVMWCKGGRSAVQDQCQQLEDTHCIHILHAKV